MLDNPIFNSLETCHAGMAAVCGLARRYPPLVTPFVGVENASDQAALDIQQLVHEGETIGILNVIPSLGDNWLTLKKIEIHQYSWTLEREVAAEEGLVKLGEEHIPAMLELTALVYPAYFRSETARLGDYYGVIQNGQLAAMGGIRMATTGFQELSAICTHPDHRGKGFASQISRHLIHHVRAKEDVPFLHTESDNFAAKRVYESLGFTLRAELPFRVVQRVA